MIPTRKPLNGYDGDVILDRVVRAEPVDRVARRVIAPGERHHVQGRNPNDTQERPRIVPFDGPRHDDLSGKRFGRLVVLGRLGLDQPYQHAKRNGYISMRTASRLWVVRCDCGMYSLRKTKTLKQGGEAIEQMCSTCLETFFLRKRIAGRE